MHELVFNVEEPTPYQAPEYTTVNTD